MTIIPQLTTAEELLAMGDLEGRFELVQGELRPMAPAGFYHGRLIMNIATPLDSYVRAHRLGVVCAAETGFYLSSNPDTVRAADVAFIRQERVILNTNVTGYWPGAPDLAVEVVSPRDLYTEVDEKVSDWLDAGTTMVIIINPRKRTVTVYQSSTITLLRDTDALQGGDVVPGWQLAVASIFA